MANPFQDRQIADALVRQIMAEWRPERPVKIMHVCGSHEHTLSRWGLRTLLPEGLELIAGPGCPVCVCPVHEIREALELARRGVILATYGDMMRVPTRHGSLAEIRAQGGDVRVIYSATEARELALAHPDRAVVFFAIGFETTAAPSAALLSQGDLPDNFSVLVSHRLTPPAMVQLLESGEVQVDAFIAPGHVSTITGAEAWGLFPKQYHRPTIVAGFEPVDVLLATWMVLRQLNRGEAKLENEYTRAVPRAANPRAKAALEQVFEVRPSWWRGLGELPASGLALKPEWAHLDARQRHGVRFEPEEEELPRGCACNRVMLGQLTPPECALYGRRCTPAAPYGPCMVSQEGTCYIWYRYGGFTGSA